MANEDLLLRQMPHSLEGEQAVLGSMLIDPDCVKNVMDRLRPGEQEYKPQNTQKSPEFFPLHRPTASLTRLQSVCAAAGKTYVVNFFCFRLGTSSRPTR